MCQRKGALALTLFVIASVEQAALALQLRAVHERGAKLFIDVTNEVFPTAWYNFDVSYKAIRHSGISYHHFTAPSFPDLNNDGVPDFFNTMHLALGDPQFFWDVGQGTLPSSAGGLAHTQYQSCAHHTIKYQADLLNERRVSSNLGALTPFFAGKDSTYLHIDPHGAAFVDIDRDGVLDLHVTQGVNSGRGFGFEYYDLVFWGINNQSDSCGINLVGGRSAAQAANLHNPEGRGRFAYWADFNNDGLLDMVIVNEPRKLKPDVPGVLMLNQGGRKFQAEHSLEGYFTALVLHDLDGDGFAQELIVAYKHCDHKFGIKYDAYGCLEQTELGAYKYDDATGKMKPLPISFGEVYTAWEARTFVTGDFDGDLLADFVVLYEDHLQFFYSSRRSTYGSPADALHFGSRDPKQNLNCTKGPASKNWPGGEILRAGDFDLDGDLDLLLVCANAGSNYIFMQKDGVWQVQSKLGSLNPEFVSEEQDLNSGYWDGASVVDFNNDGFLDVALASHGHLHMFQNPYADENAANRFIAVELRGNSSNTNGVGATIILTVCNEGFHWPNDVECSRQLREVNCVGHEVDKGGYRDGRHIFGLGKRGVAQGVSVFWPGKGGHVQHTSQDPKLLEAHVNRMDNPFIIEEDEWSNYE